VELRAVKAALELEFERLTAEHAALIEQRKHLTGKKETLLSSENETILLNSPPI
jgi:hypothetical protein